MPKKKNHFLGFSEQSKLISAWSVDYFRKSPENPPPLACFLSHVHSDHLQGLESLRAPFVYCSAATREILLRIEKYPHRMNFSKGILESRKQHYKHLAKLLRPLPLHVPTEIELMPRCHIRVTLFDANHCPGAVMFLIEGNGKAVLYTGDIRAEPWWVNSITRNPVLIPYTVGKKRLDRIYLDTTFAIKSDIYRTFPSKAEGIRELLEALQRYPEDTTFYLRAWTFGYEDVWLALSAALNTQVHVDRYQMGLYKSLAKGSNNGLAIDEAPFLCGFTLGNSHIPGCLTDDQSSRIHSCEPGMLCAKISNSPSVFITPIVTRTSEGVEVAEVGAGGGKGDLYQSHDLELSDEATLQQLAAFCAEQIQDEAARSMAVAALFEAYKSKSKTLSLNEYGIKEEDEISIREFVNLLARDGRNVEGTVKDIFPESTASRVRKTGKTNNSLSQTVTFPYSRHSSYAELCGLVEAFKPKDIYPCTVDVETWNEDVSIRTLFGHLCSGTEFSHDNDMQELLQSDEYRPRKRMRRASDSSSIALSTQRSALEIISVEHSDSLTHLVEAETRTSPSEVPLETASQVQAENRREASNPSASQYQNVDTSSQSTNPRISAVKAALKQKRQDNELDFYLPSSFSSEFDSQGTSQLSISSKPKGPEDEGHEPDSIGYMSSNQLHGEPQRGGSSQTTNVDEHPDTQPDDDIESTLTLSPSAFDSQHSTVEQQQRTTRDPNDANNSNAAPTLISISSSASSDSLPALAQPPASSSLQRRDSRMAAYRAARSGSYEAWSSFCTPVSAGNNHTEEDVEL